MNNLIVNAATIQVVTGDNDADDSLTIQYDRERRYTLNISDDYAGEDTGIDRDDFPMFVQSFLTHKNRLSALSKNPMVARILIPLPDSDRQCYMDMENEMCIFPRTDEDAQGRNFEVRVSFVNMEQIIRMINSIS